MSVSYGGDRYKAYDGGRPVVTNLSLSFKEMDLITREHIEGAAKNKEESLICILIKIFQ